MQLPADVEPLRASLAAYTSFALAKQGGYDPAAITDCLSNGDEGAMGFHYANVAGCIDGTVDARHPEVLITSPAPTAR